MSSFDASNMTDQQFEEYIAESRKKTPVVDPEFDSFVGRVDAVNAIMKGLTSTDSKDVERATRQAEIYLHTKTEVDEKACTVGLDRTAINRKAFEAGPITNKDNEQDSMNPEAFMAVCEADANKRAADKNQRSVIADAYKSRGNAAYRKGDFDAAYALFSKAIDEIRDSGVLYTNRALCCLQLRVHQRAVSDCDWAIKLNENNLKAWLYKAKAHHRLAETEQADKCIVEAESRHPDRREEIREYRSQWETPTEDN